MAALKRLSFSHGYTIFRRFPLVTEADPLPSVGAQTFRS
jgi:hypothetical protein